MAYHHGNLREALIEATVDMIGQSGSDGVSLRMLGRALGVSRSAPYRHFRNKADLLAAVAEQGFCQMTDAMVVAREAETCPIVRFREIGVAYVQFATRHPAHFEVMFGDGIRDRDAYPHLAFAAKSAFECLANAVIDCQEHGLIACGDPGQYALAAWSLVHGMSALLIGQQLRISAEDDAAVAARARTVGMLLFDGLRTSGQAQLG